MKLDDAIRAALEYETGIHRIYQEAMEKTTDDTAKRVYQVLCREEQEHLNYLRDRLAEWRTTGKVAVKDLKTAIPGEAAIDKVLKDVRAAVKPKRGRPASELELLKKALDAEIKATEFYRQMVSKLDGEGRELFRRFIEIEAGHEAIVRAEINTVGNWGFWFDMPEFRLEME